MYFRPWSEVYGDKEASDILLSTQSTHTLIPDQEDEDLPYTKSDPSSPSLSTTGGSGGGSVAFSRSSSLRSSGSSTGKSLLNLIHHHQVYQPLVEVEDQRLSQDHQVPALVSQS